ncbi:MAG: tetratricopeptide repeat protein [Acidobacteriia bacterium]|nr:tetratricopeptide repeat protein [Terriglobia bacterium]
MAGAAFVLALQADFTNLYRQAYEERLHADHPKTAESAADLALYLVNRGSFTEAAPFLPQVLAAKNPDPAALHNWAVALEDQSPALAERLYRRALALRVSTLPPADPELATTRLNLGALLLSSSPRESETLARAALAAFERSLGATHARTGAACGTLATALATQGDVPGAERLFRRALTIAGKAHGPNSRETAAALENLADLLEQTGRESAALPLRQRAQRILAVNPDPVVGKPQQR